MAKYYIGGENQTTIEKLLAGETVIVNGKGNSMTPKLMVFRATAIKYPTIMDMITGGLNKSMENMSVKPQMMNSNRTISL